MPKYYAELVGGATPNQLSNLIRIRAIRSMLEPVSVQPLMVCVSHLNRLGDAPTYLARGIYQCQVLDACADAIGRQTYLNEDDEAEALALVSRLRRAATIGRRLADSQAVFVKWS